MTPVIGRKGPVRYRYYASHATTQGRHADAGSVPRVPAHDIETAIIAELKRVASEDNDVSDKKLLADWLDRAILSKASIELHIRLTDSDVERIQIPWSAPSHRRRRSVRESEHGHCGEYIRSTERARLLSGIARARAWVRRLLSGEAVSLTEIARAEGISERSARMALPLAFLAPVVILAAIDGTLPRGQAVTRPAEPGFVWQKVAD